ncbi:phytanoyl-CoA dioxygenase family protein [Thioflavicoccus mobilis]|nr:phytanoyl-CoA dioxygenase family protein [Thioflavicoccus mobilis]
METGTLGVRHLRRFWHGRLAMVEGHGGRARLPEEESLDRILMDGLGLGIVEPDIFIFNTRPSYAQFERWILDTLGGELGADTVERVNRAVADCLDGPQHEYPTERRISNPVLSPEEMAFWEENGYVVLRRAAPAEDARAAELAVWEFLGKDPKRPETWYDTEHLFWTPLFRHPALDRNRASPRIHKAFAQVWGTENLLVTVDRASLNLPLHKDGIDRSGPSGLHWDASIAQPMSFGVQGILYLTDTPAEQGAFQCVPGFHHRMGEWLAGLPPGTAPRTAALDLEAVPVAAGAGDLIIWRHDLPHGSSRNSGRYPRVAQYISMYPPDFPKSPVWQ